MSELMSSSPSHLPLTLVKRDAGQNVLYSPKWFAVFTTPRHEKRIAFHCDQRQIESFLPLYQEVRQWKNRCKVKLDLPLFPNYIFVRIQREERFRVLNVPGVLSILGSGADLYPVQDEYIDSLRLGLETHKIEPHSHVEVGDTVRIIAGAMTGMEGVLVRKKNELRVVIRVALLDRCMSVEVTTADIEFVAPAHPRAMAVGMR
jgi:transcription antitermination factor NusG